MYLRQALAQFVCFARANLGRQAHSLSSIVWRKKLAASIAHPAHGKVGFGVGNLESQARCYDSLLRLGGVKSQYCRFLVRRNQTRCSKFDATKIAHHNHHAVRQPLATDNAENGFASSA